MDKTKFPELDKCVFATFQGGFDSLFLGDVRGQVCPCGAVVRIFGIGAWGVHAWVPVTTPRASWGLFQREPGFWVLGKAGQTPRFVWSFGVRVGFFIPLSMHSYLLAFISACVCPSLCLPGQGIPK